MDRCPLEICDGSGFVVDEETRTATPCECRPQLVSRRRVRSLNSVIPRRYRDVSFDRNPVAQMPEAIVRHIRYYIRDIDANLDAGRGLWLTGDPGTGKTSLAMLVSRHALDAGRSVGIFSLPRLLNEIRRTYRDDSEQSYLELLDHLAQVDLLHLDDLGSQSSNEWVLEQLYSVINSRYEAERSVVVTTNLDVQELTKQITARTVSRLEEMCTVIPLHGGDNRQVVGRQAS
jgi:DNA replication protein DnaC